MPQAVNSEHDPEWVAHSLKLRAPPYSISITSAFSIPKGKITAIVGASGSGKTTLLKLLLAFYEPQQGKIIFDDQDMKVTDTNDYRQKCGVVMQDGFIYNTSIAQNVAMQEKNIDKARVKLALETACLWEFVETLPQKLSLLLLID